MIFEKTIPLLTGQYNLEETLAALSGFSCLRPNMIGEPVSSTNKNKT
jgi:hypothetical protein